nr:uncharacterized protein LOC122272794 [Parasteatoda tepidariorum]
MAENEQVFSSAHQNKSGTASLPSFNLSNCSNYDPSKSKFLVLSSAEKKLSSMSPFLVQKSLETHIGNPKHVKPMPSGDLLVETNSTKQTTSLLKLNQIGNVKITVTPHNTLNISKGVISEKALQSIPISEILEGLSDQGVIDARHITIKKGSDIFTTQHIILTFNSADLPIDIKAGYRNCKIRPYIPNPLRCFKCQKFGHSTNNCRGKETCSRCGQPGHSFRSCSSPEKCANCNEDHSANSRRCLKWKQEKQILSIKVTQNLSYFEAKTKFLSSQPRPNVSYAAAVMNPISNTKHTKSVGCQCDFTESETQNNKPKTVLPRQTANQTISSQSQQTKNPEKSASPSPIQNTSESQRYVKLTPQLINKLQQKLTQSPVTSKLKYIPKSRQNKFHKDKLKKPKNKELSQSDAMSTDEENRDELPYQQMQTDEGLEAPPNLCPKSKLKIKR